LFVFGAARLNSAARMVSFTLTLLLLAAFSGAVFGFAEVFPAALPPFFADLAWVAALPAALPAAALPVTVLAVRPGLAPTFRAVDEDLLVGVPGLFPWDESLSAEALVPFPTDEGLTMETPATSAALFPAGLSSPALAAFC
jgi:hypothetical protein